MQSLNANPERRFIYAEISFFHKWWSEQSSSVRKLTQQLVDQGRLAFVDGGWTQHDEACNDFGAMIDQTTLGHRFLTEEFNYTPSIGWQIDPFGHSYTEPSLLGAELGFDALFFARLDYQDRDKRRKERSMEMLWRGSPSLGDRTELFTGAFLEGSYGPPEGLCWDTNACPDAAPVQDDPALESKRFCLSG